MIDAHTHLTDEQFDGDRGAVIARAAAGGITMALTCGEDVANSQSALELARGHNQWLRVAVGIHPHRAGDKGSADLEGLRELARDPLVVAIGEMGIDLSGRSAPLPAQEAAFSGQLALAAELNLPVVIHCRDAGDVVRRLLDEGPPIRGQLHCYSEGPAQVEGWLRRGLWISFAGTVTFPSAVGLREAARVVPADRLLVETDAPYLSPVPLRGRRNEPAHIAATYALLAEVRGESPGELVAKVAASARALFGERWA